MAATVQANRDSGALTGGHGTTVASAETGVTYARNEAGTTAIPIPTATGTKFSWPLWLSLNVTATGGSTTHLANRVAKLASALATGLHLWGKAVAAGSYVQPAGNADADSGSNGATPTGYTEITTTGFTFDAASVQNNTGQNGGYCEVALGVDFLFTGGGGTATLPNLNMLYDEGPNFIPFGALLSSDHRVQAASIVLGLVFWSLRRWRRRKARMAQL